jgi:threonine/homoserine/homoserine lactone efflux protein
MLDYTLLALFIPTFLLVSSTPGMCMTLAMTLGMTIGIRKTLWMMWGEMAGVAVVAVSAVIGVASLMLNYPGVFSVFKYLGGAYLIFIGVQQWLSLGKMAIGDPDNNKTNISGKKLMLQGFVTAIANPKGWAFTISLLPPFINPELAIAPQLFVLVFIILCSEFLFMMLYATGGKSLGKLLGKSGNVRLINRVSGSLMILIGVWLALG